MADTGPVSGLTARTPLLLSTDRMYIDNGSGGDLSVRDTVIAASVAAMLGFTLGAASTLNLAASSAFVTSGAHSITLVSTADSVAILPAGTTSLAPLGSPTFIGTITTPAISLAGNITQAAWTTSGVRIKGTAVTLTDTTSSGTVAAAYTNVLGGNTIAASSTATFTNYFTTYISEPAAGTNVTFTNKWALGLLGNAAISGAVSIGGATLGSNALAVTGAINISSSGTFGGNLTSLNLNVTQSNGSVQVPNGGFFVVGSRGSISASADGVFLIADNAGTSVSGIKFGLTTSAAPYIKRNGAGIDFRLADDSAGTTISASMGTFTPVSAGNTAIVAFFDTSTSKGNAIGVAASGDSFGRAVIGLDLGTPYFGFGAGSTARDVFLARLGAANLRLGAAPSGSPIAQIFTLGEASIGGTSNNVAGSNGTLQSGAGTGSGTGSSLIFQTPTTGSTGTTAQTYATRLTLTDVFAKVASGTQFWVGNAATTGLTAGVLSALTNASIVIYDSAGQAYRVPCII